MPPRQNHLFTCALSPVPYTRTLDEGPHRYPATSRSLDIMSKLRTAISLILIVLAAPSVAVARTKPVLPTGDSGISQYIESVPTARGQSATGVVRQTAGSRQGAGAVSGATQRALSGYGSAGVQAASLAEATGSATTHRTTVRSRATALHQNKRRSRTRHGRSSTKAAVAPSRPTPPGPSGGSGSASGSAVADAITGVGGGLGMSALPLILIAIVAAAVGIRLRRRPSTD